MSGVQIKWNPEAGWAHSNNVTLVSGEVPGAPSSFGSLRYLSATSEAAKDFCCASVWAGDELLVRAKVKALPAVLAPVVGVDVDGSPFQLDLGAGAAFGDVAEIARGEHTAWGSKRTAAGLLVLPPAQAAVLMAFAMRGAVRRLVYTSRDFRNGQPQLDNARLQGAPLPGPPALPGEMGELATGTIIIIIALGAAAIAGVTYGAVEVHKADVAFRVEEVQQVSKVRVAIELARMKIAAGQEIDIPAAVESMGRSELRASTLWPFVAGVAGFGVVGTGVGVALYRRWKKKKGGARVEGH